MLNIEYLNNQYSIINYQFPNNSMSNNKCSVLHVCTVGITARVFLVPIFKRLQSEKFDITFACTDDADARFVEKQNIPFFPVTISRKISLSDLFAAIKLYRYIKKHKFQIVNTHTAKAGFVGRFSAWLAGVPCIIHTAHGLTVHEYQKRWISLIYNFLEKWIGRHTDFFIAVTEKVKKELINQKVATFKKISVIHNGIDLLSFTHELIKVNKTDGLHNILRTDNNTIIIGTLSRIVPHKGLEDLIDAFGIICNQRKNIKLVIAGDGELKKSLQEQSIKLGISDKISWLGWQTDVPEVLSCFDIFSLPTLREGFGYVFLEAQAMGIPVVTTKIAPLTETLGTSALLVAPQSPEQLASSLLKLINDENFRKKLRIKGIKNVRQNFDQQKQCNEIANFYKKLKSDIDTIS